MDHLIIDGRVYTAGPEYNCANVNALVDLKESCERKDDEKNLQLFLGCHSPFSNLYLTNFSVDNVTYLCVEQYLQQTNKIDIPQLFYRNCMLTEPTMIADAFNEHFATVGKRVQSTINKPSNADPLKYVKSVNDKLQLKCVRPCQFVHVVKTQ